METRSGRYAEGAHIKALGEPHNGPDKESNILCLCPNHHVLFDMGWLSINDDYSLNGMQGKLHVHPDHQLDKQCIKYHREESKN